jgi:hypothetical protein
VTPLPKNERFTVTMAGRNSKHTNPIILGTYSTPYLSNFLRIFARC